MVAPSYGFGIAVTDPYLGFISSLKVDIHFSSFEVVSFKNSCLRQPAKANQLCTAL